VRVWDYVGAIEIRPNETAIEKSRRGYQVIKTAIKTAIKTRPAFRESWRKKIGTK